MASGTETVTVLFTDVVGSTELRAGRGDESAQRILEEHFELVRQQVERHSGQEVKTMGDGFMVAFSSARRAVDCAVAVQGALAAHNREDPDQQVQVRIGLHTGEVIQKEKDLFGVAVDAAARIVSEATGGQILVSEAVHSVIGPAKDVNFIDSGLFQLKGLPERWRLYEVRWQEKTLTEPSKTIAEEKTSPSIAVLPFVNMSADEEQEYFCDGLAEELINALTQISDLHVVARTSSFSFKKKEVDIHEIGQKLKVQTVLEGSVRKAGNRLRITAQLVNVADGYHLWSEKYDRDMEDIFAIQDEISQAIVDKLQVELLGSEKAGLAKRHTVDLEAYDLYLKGLWSFNKYTEDGLKKAVKYFEQAIEKDPEYAVAYAGVSDSYILQGFYGYLPPKSVYPRATKQALKALEIDDTVAGAHKSLAAVKLWDWDWVGAEESYKRAIELNPNHADAHYWYGFMLSCTGRVDEAIKEAKRAQELDRLSLPVNILRRA